MTDEKRPVDQAVELVLFAPIGFALEARRLLPSFVERGRQQVQMAKMIGQFAVKQGETEGKARLAKAQVQAEAILAEFGLRASEDEAPSDHVVAVAPAAPEPGRPPAARSSAASAELAVSDYDSLAASQVIPRLPGLEASELEAVRRYEAAHRGRKTILGKIAQIQGE
ncbi:hypothetical protein BH10ACT1_BH10ACT1_27210 [soil metagenome]